MARRQIAVNPPRRPGQAKREPGSITTIVPVGPCWAAIPPAANIGGWVPAFAGTTIVSGVSYHFTRPARTTRRLRRGPSPEIVACARFPDLSGPGMSAYDAGKRSRPQRCHPCLLSGCPRPFRNLTFNRRRSRKPCSGPPGKRFGGQLPARLFSAPVIQGDAGVIGRRARDVAPALRLRFSPLEIFAQRQFQPVLPGVFRRARGLPLAVTLLILHRRPVECAAH